MGAQLVRVVQAKALGGGLSGLSSRAMLVLIAMALDAHDTGTEDTPARCYFRGWLPLALMLGHPGLTPGGKSAVARAIRELTDAGLIKVDPGYRGSRFTTTYRLTLGAL